MLIKPMNNNQNTPESANKGKKISKTGFKIN